MAILAILMTVGVSVVGQIGSRARGAGAEMLVGLIERARTEAITSRTNVMLAIAEPGDFPARDEVCRLGLFKVDSWPNSSSAPLRGELLGRWRTLSTGVVLAGGRIDGLENPLDGSEVTISYTNSKLQSVKVHAITFNSRGGLRYPEGSSPVVMRVAEGSYRGGKATPFVRGKDRTISENRLRIGRVTARPYLID